MMLDIWISGISFHYAAFSFALGDIINEPFIILNQRQLLELRALQRVEFVLIPLPRNQLIFIHRIV